VLKAVVHKSQDHTAQHIEGESLVVVVVVVVVVVGGGGGGGRR